MTLRSMTGFGSSSVVTGRIKIDAEIKSVNSRFLDLSCRIPQPLSAVEPEVSKLIRGRLARGRVELFVVRTLISAQPSRPTFNPAAFEDLFSVSKEALTAAGIDWRAHLPQLAFALLSRREVIESTAADDALLQPLPEEAGLVLNAVEQALAQLVLMREEEGRALTGELVRLLASLESSVAAIEVHAAGFPLTFAERLKTRLAKLAPAGEIDPLRLAQEVAVLAERTDITEELARLKSHIGQFHKYLAESISGKKLDFLIQELGREFNTVGSKVQNSDVAILVVEAKAALEKIREQVQNVE